MNAEGIICILAYNIKKLSADQKLSAISLHKCKLNVSGPVLSYSTYTAFKDDKLLIHRWP